MFTLLLLLSVPFLAATNVPFKNCGAPTDHIKINSLDAVPFPPVPAKDLTVTASANLDEVVTNGTVEVHVKFYGAELYHGVLGICDLDPQLPCPFQPGVINVQQTLTLPKQVPHGPYELNAIAKDSKGQPLFCMIVPFTIKESAAVTPELVEKVNRANAGWTAGMNAKFTEATLEEARQLCGVLEGGQRLPERNVQVLAVPDNFDARDQWGAMCPSVKEVRDQGPCGSCWAFGAAHAMTDRTCIAHGGSFKADLAAADMVSCCWFCGMGCNGGYPPMAWRYFELEGVVTGGFQETGDGCLPYYWPRCEHHTTGKYAPCPDSQKTPACHKECKQGYPIKWDADKHHAKSVYSVKADVATIQNEIYQNGPVEAAFSVYQDFLAYKSGVYRHVSGEMLGGHAISIYGWGVLDGTPYWLVKNSWNEDWGDGGFFKILRGSDECGIESQVVAGLAK